MELMLNEGDLLKRFREVPWNEVTFEHFKPSVQDAILWAGNGRSIYEAHELCGGTNRIKVFFPKECPERWRM